MYVYVLNGKALLTRNGAGNNNNYYYLRLLPARLYNGYSSC